MVKVGGGNPGDDAMDIDDAMEMENVQPHNNDQEAVCIALL